MKVTAIIDDKLIKEAMKYANTSTITEAVKIALNAYISSQKLKHLGHTVKNNPLKFNTSAEDIRDLNREI